MSKKDLLRHRHFTSNGRFYMSIGVNGALANNQTTDDKVKDCEEKTVLNCIIQIFYKYCVCWQFKSWK